ncbi:7-carboxy-7-deazaguanine synthase QueE [Methylophilaceae bacterium]|nr:7-carboxy-7-deazaguanine synthase QueE [Methylophilaceae bacterium]
MQKLKVNEIFYSLQGESSNVGLPTIFIRLTGCPMRCSYCDTEYAFNTGDNFTIDHIIETISQYKAKNVTVTGGEPLAQKECWDLLKRLCDEGYSVSLETGGAISIGNIDKRVKIILDIKTPGSGEDKNNFWENLELIKPQDEIKFVIADMKDYIWAKEILIREKLNEKALILFSPVFNDINPKDLAEWILKDQLPVRFQIQLHKIIWGEVPGV